MSLFVLDTDTLTLYQRLDVRVCARVLQHRGAPDDRIGLAVTTIEEQFDGWRTAFHQAKDNRARALASRMLAEAVTSWRPFEIFPLTEPVLATFDRLGRMKLNVGSKDLRIAAVALELAATVVTRNRRDFTRVPGLPVEDWAA